MSPIRPVRPTESARALRLVEKLWVRISRWTASRVSADTSGRSLITRETVATETPAMRAMSRIVGFERLSEVSVICARIPIILP